MRAIPPPSRRDRSLPWTLLLALAPLAACVDDITVPTTSEPAKLATSWETAAPREVELDAIRLELASARAASVDRLRSLLVVRHGRLAHERYFHGNNAETLADVRSITKTVVGALVGVAMAHGAIDGPDQPITDFLSTDEYPVRAEHASITVGDLLTMSSGIDWTERGATGYLDWIQSSDRVAYLLERELVADPGDVFAYNSAAVHLLGLIVEEATGRSLPSFADDVLFGPLGIDRREWEPLGDRHVNGGGGIDLRPRDLARLGQLFLQNGRSGTTQVVPEGWAQLSLAPTRLPFRSVPPMGTLSYGLLWWIDVERTAAFAWGYGGQLVYVDPDLDLVVVVTTDWWLVSQDVGSEWLTEQAMSLIVDAVLPAVR